MSEQDWRATKSMDAEKQMRLDAMTRALKQVNEAGK